MISKLSYMQRQANIALSPRNHVAGPTVAQLTSNILADGTRKMYERSDTPEPTWDKNLELLLLSSEKAKVGYRKYYLPSLFSYKSEDMSHDLGGLVRPRIYTNDHRSFRLSKLADIADAVKISSYLVVSFLVKALADIYRYCFNASIIASWGAIASERSKSFDLTRSPLSLSGNSVQHQSSIEFETPRVRAGMIALTSFDFQNCDFPPGVAHTGNPPRTTNAELSNGEACTVASLTWLAPEDANKKEVLFPSNVVMPFLSSELRIHLSTHINGLLLPESNKQVAGAFHDSFDLKDVNGIIKRIPHLFGQGSVKMHAGLIAITDRATFISKRGDIDLFTLTEHGGLRLLKLGMNLPPISLGTTNTPENNYSEVLSIPHAGNEDTIFLMASPKTFSKLEKEDEKRLYRWAISEAGCGFSIKGDAPIGQSKKLFENFGSVFVCSHNR